MWLLLIISVVLWQIYDLKNAPKIYVQDQACNSRQNLHRLIQQEQLKLISFKK